ncbi:hypothetical protein LMG28727_07762 [Paraburkholderia kirstenboschensis]|nr:hypothetical protein LMG28727_07762 [Paraburkholderia kirstenboschensis]
MHNVTVTVDQHMGRRKPFKYVGVNHLAQGSATDFGAPRRQVARLTCAH